MRKKEESWGTGTRQGEKGRTGGKRTGGRPLKVKKTKGTGRSGGGLTLVTFHSRFHSNQHKMSMWYWTWGSGCKFWCWVGIFRRPGYSSKNLVVPLGKLPGCAGHCRSVLASQACRGQCCLPKTSQQRNLGLACSHCSQVSVHSFSKFSLCYYSDTGSQSQFFPPEWDQEGEPQF